MPIEIRELVIKATILQDLNSSSAQSNGVPPSEELVKVCVEKVLEILKERNER
ncbi:DUF5908 family protein [Pedobacter sp. FW305-3-2-15-E-R2A2]|jgi:hypothetical protein|uniref:DUF5908 family protein n=1 Tax=Pedobacter sp. FW305-3-2-15-E-R2A2 TaxID=3140251 RepID=UPI00313FF18E